MGIGKTRDGLRRPPNHQPILQVDRARRADFTMMNDVPTARNQILLRRAIAARDDPNKPENLISALLPLSKSADLRMS
ncbi:hypothetical protein I4U23_000046 [Adineta vaga]|nr:hypothetical protein I4U23_000046 [Adineta vaga]